MTSPGPAGSGPFSTTLVILGALVGLAFVLVGGTIAVVYSDGNSSQVVLPVLLAQIGPLIVLIMTLAKAAENGAKSDIVSSQMHENTTRIIDAAKPPPQPPVVVNVPPPETHTGVTPSGPA